MEKRKGDLKKITKSFLKYLGVFLLILLFILLIFFLVLRSTYLSWKEERESDLVILDLEEDISGYERELEESIEEYSRAEGTYSFIELSKKESLLLFSKAFEDSLPNVFQVNKMGLLADYGEWRVFVKTEAFSIDLPWIGFYLKKEGMQSIDIYVEDIFLGNVSLSRLFLRSQVESINEGISKSIELIGKGEFLGKEFENIEFKEDEMVIRSREATF